jgi:hypothetical protein
MSGQAQPAGSGAGAPLLRAAGGVLVCLAAVEAAVAECFYVPLRVGRWPLPLAVAGAVAGNVVLPRLVVAATGRRGTALLPPVVWLIVALLFAASRPEGDLVVPGTASGLAFLFLGAIAGAFGAVSASPPRRAGPGVPAAGWPAGWPASHPADTSGSRHQAVPARPPAAPPGRG